MDGRARSHRSCPRPGRYPDSRGCPASGRLGRPAGPAARVRAGRWLRAGEPRGPLGRRPVRVRRRRHHGAVGARGARHARARVPAGEEPAAAARPADPRGAAFQHVPLRLAGRRARPHEPRQPRDHAHHRTLTHLRHRADPGRGRARPSGRPRAAAGGGTMKQAPVMLLAALLAHGCGGSGSRQPGSQSGAGKALKIAVIPKGTTHEFWKSIHAGAIEASRELSGQGTPIDIIWKGPLREDDREQQIQVVEGFLSQGVQGIVLAPLDSRALVRPVEEARRAGVPTVVIDSRLESDSVVSFVATDNHKGGQLAASRLGELLGGKGKVLLLRYAAGSASTTERERGFLEELHARYPGVALASADQYAGPTRETAKRASENLLNRYSGDVQGIFTPNESSTIGMLLALQDVGLAGKVRFIGFDAARTLIDAVRARQLDGVVVQNPMRMGYLGVKTMAERLRGKPVERLIDTGVMLG